MELESRQIPDLSNANQMMVECLLSTTIRALQNMARLKHLTISIPLGCSTFPRLDFDPKTVSLPSIHTLRLGLSTEWIIQICPNVASIARYREPEGGVGTTFIKIEAFRSLIRSASEATNLQHFKITAWSLDILEAAVESLPRLTSLTIGSCYTRLAIRLMMPIISRLIHLTYLQLPEASALGVGFHPPRCGNVYHGPNGKAVREQVKKDRLEAERKVAHLAFTACERLEVVAIGKVTVATAERASDGSLLDFNIMPKTAF